MKFLWFSVILFSQHAYSRQLLAKDGSSLWIAEVSDDHDCDDMAIKIKGYGMANRRILESDMFVDEMKGEDDCFVSFSGNQDLADGVAHLEGVVEVSSDEEVNMFWNRDRADQDDLPLDGALYNPIFNGDGQCLYVVDTGIFPGHDDFGGRAILGGDFVKETNEEDGNGHGTHCASTAAGAMYGIAPMTSVIYGVKVLGSTGSGSSAGVIRGIQWAVAHAKKSGKTCVISMSLGGGQNTALNKAAENAAKNNFVVVAAGNSNMDACSSSPAGAEGNVITVGSTKKDDFRSSFSNYGKCTDIFGPGSDITSAYIGGNKMTKILSGTSMATPYIAGLALQSLQKNDGNYKRAYDDLFAVATFGKVKNAGSGSPNIMGRTFGYTGPPTPPTIQPTMPPTMPDPMLCKWNEKNDKYSVDFIPSTFGTFGWMDKPIIAPVVFSLTDLCTKSKQDFKGKIVIIDRGECMFFIKVMLAEAQGAVAVLIANDSNGAIFAPAYYGSKKTNLPSCMISRDTKLKTFNDGDILLWGPVTGWEEETVPTNRPTKSTNPPKPVPTNRPTKSTNPPKPVPTNRPTKSTNTPRPSNAPTMPLRCDPHNTKAVCDKDNKCNWDGYICYIKWKYQKKR
jgi:hypothetical protein